jgi:hypothetical protein
MMQKNLTLEIENYISSVGEVHEDGVEYQKSSNASVQTKVVIWEVVEFTGMAKTIPIVKIME